MEHPVRICKQWRYCDVIGWRLIWQCCRLSLPVWSSEPLFIFCGLKNIVHMLFTVKCIQWLSSFWPDEENAGWTEICLRYGGAMGRSSVAFAAADFIFLLVIHKLVERWDKCLNKLGGYVEKWLHNARKSLHLKFQTGKNLLVFV